MKNRRDYRYIVCEIFEAPNENSRHKIRARPLAGQWAGPMYRIECPLGIRTPDNVGECYRFVAKFKDTLAAPQLYTSYRWPPVKVTPLEAFRFLAAQNWEIEKE